MFLERNYWSQMALVVCAEVDSTEYLFARLWWDLASRQTLMWVSLLSTKWPK